MVPLVVDPQALFAVGSAVIAAGEGLAANLTVLTAGFAAHTGLDAAGAVFGLAYQDAGESVLQAAAAAINACRQSGALIQQGAANYSQAEAASTLGGGAGALQAPPAQPKMSAPGPPGTWGKGQPPPLLWAVVQSFVDDVWPDGDVAGLHAAAARWRGFAGSAGGMRSALNAAKALLDAHQIPEGEKIDDALSQIGDCMGKIGEASGKLATALDNFANEVAGAQSHIRDLLNRLGSLTDLGHDVMLIIKGDALEEIKKIAKDINDVLHDLGREARAAEQGVKAGLGVVDGLVVKLEKYVRREATQFLGDAVGNQVATVFDVFANANEGALKGAVGMALSIGDLDPRWFLVDPHGAAATWTDMAKGLWKGSLVNGFVNPQEFVDANWQQLKALLHLDDWSTARPGLGFGENAFDVAMFFIPGAGEAGAATEAGGAALQGAEAAEAAGAAGRAGAEAAGGLAGARGALADLAGAGRGLTNDLEGVTGRLPKIEPPPVGGRPVDLPAPKPLEAPVESVPRPPDAAPGAHEPGPLDAAPPEPERAVHEPPPEPSAVAPAAGGPHDPVPATSPASHPPSIPAAADERVPSTMPQLVDHSPVRGPVSPSGVPVEPAPVAAHPPQPAPSFASAAPPHSMPLGGRPAELPSPGGGWHGHGEGGPAGAPHGRPPHAGGPHGSGDRPNTHGSDDSSPNHRGSPHDSGTTGETPDGPAGVHEPPTPTKVPGVDYSLPATDALRVLDQPGAELKRLADGGVPSKIFEGYEPLAGRTPVEFEREFAVRGPDGKTFWDWDVQAPKNGFAGHPFETNHIPTDLRLDRLGPNGGGFLSPEGIPLAERATPPGLAAQYHLFEGTGREIPPGQDWVVQHGPAKGAFGQPGGGDQWIVLDKSTGKPVPVDELIKARLLREITPSK
ncbi:hypothetical protein A5787_08445 [Mycobacterium sp. 852002-50816_SCH5313054-b]|uniref:glycohydrolase toxin TNT-related protein n=1 Tax=Mycobacterium sp. 852002-50816_SCH5313054-b TaxID=1834092 RepID=UPI0007FFA2AD|nr:glycohydrolase toxin TNT-related protein [Mycobacterium sp. 852002-50816_SCH5313054-b]OBF50300.1 hypothetical protein A5787_08445 [Mycobacterium sp. 852002-50816_SCH5313054-b]